MGRTLWSAPDAIVRLFERCSEKADLGSAADEGVRPTLAGRKRLNDILGWSSISRPQRRRGRFLVDWSAVRPRNHPYRRAAFMISLRNIEKYFEHGPTKTFVLRRVNIEIKEGEFVSIMGPSGAGKSTLLHLLGMHDASWTGEYDFLDFPIHKLKKKDRDEISKKYFGFVFQAYHLIDSLTVYENLDIPLSYRNVRKSDREGLVADMLDRFNMVGKKDLFPNQLSGGQQQLVAIARAIISTPKVILADEPTGNLHTNQAKEIMSVFKQLNDQGTTIIQVTHSEANAAYGNRIIQIEDGWIA